MTEPVELAQRLGALLEAGRRVATYKLALLLALIDTCSEADVPPGPGQPFSVSILDLADRVIDLYWPQARVYPARAEVLRQNKGPTAVVVRQVQSLRSLAPTPAMARVRHPDAYRRARRTVGHTLATQPLPALQTPGARSATKVQFLYDDSWMSDGMPLKALEDRGWRLELRPGVADGLVRLSSLLRPVIEGHWVSDVAAMNDLDREYQDLPDFLFGAERSSLGRAARALRELEGPICFYCRRPIAGTAHVDHFIPWARVPFNGLANLVLTDAACNGDKSDGLVGMRHVEAWHHRDTDGLEQIGTALDWPVELLRARRIVRGTYERLPSGTPLWEAKGVYLLSP